jgi:predicted enzyme related to lactoylglutathione lyase
MGPSSCDSELCPKGHRTGPSARAGLPPWAYQGATRRAEAALQKAERLGGTRRLGPDQAPGRDLVIGHFTDPEGNLVGLASIP